MRKKRWITGNISIFLKVVFRYAEAIADEEMDEEDI